MATTSQAHDAHDPPPGHLRTADLLGALSLAADLAVGLPAEHAVRSCLIGMRIADHLDLTEADRADVYYAHLLMDVGCTAWTSQLAGSILGDEIEGAKIVTAANVVECLASGAATLSF